MILQHKRKTPCPQFVPRVYGLFFLLAISAMAQGETGGLFVNPLRVEITAPPGASHEDRIALRNDSREPLNVCTEIIDATPLPKGASWIQTDMDSIVLQPGEQRELTYQVAVPKEASGELRARIAFAKDETNDADSLQIVGRLAVPIYVIIRGTEIRKAQIMEIRPCPHLSNRMEIAVVNEGNVHIRPQGSLRILDKSGTNTVAEVSVNEWGYPVFPGETDSLVTAEWDHSSLPQDGLYEAVLTFDGITLSHRQSASFDP